MKKTHARFAILVVSAVLLHACKKDPISFPAGGGIRFDSMAVGQSARYVCLFGENYVSVTSGDFVYTDDTLVMEIVAQDANGFKVAERLRYAGTVHAWMADEPDETYYYYLSTENDSLQLKPASAGLLRSRIFSYGMTTKRKLPLTDITTNPVAIAGWKTAFPYCECRQEGYALDYSLFGQTYDRLNVVVENSDMAVDGPGETYIYAPQYGIVRFSIYSWWTQSGYGWDLLPSEQ
jgi:hypothetical protein